MATQRIDCDILLVAIHVQGHSISYACTTCMWTLWTLTTTPPPLIDPPP